MKRNNREYARTTEAPSKSPRRSTDNHIPIYNSRFQVPVKPRKLGDLSRRSINIFLYTYNLHRSTGGTVRVIDLVPNPMLEMICLMNFPPEITPVNIIASQLLTLLKRKIRFKIEDIPYLKSELHKRVQLNFNMDDPEARIKQLFLSLTNAMEDLAIPEESNDEGDITLCWKTQERRLLRALPEELGNLVIRSLAFASPINPERNLFIHMVNEAKFFNWTKYEKLMKNQH